MVGVVSGGSVFLIGVLLVILALPVLVGFLPTSLRAEMAGLQVMLWTAAAMIALVMTGGLRSPLTILFVVGPLYGLARGRRRIALEATAFAAIGFFGLWSLDAWLGTPALTDSLQTFTTAITLSAIAFIGVLSANVIVAQQQRTLRDTSRRSAASETGRALDLRPGISLPATLPITAISVTPLGRIRTIEGERKWLGPVKVGQDVCTALARLDPELESAFPFLQPETAIQHSEYGELKVLSRASATGAVIVIQRSGMSESALAAVRDEADMRVRDRTAFFASLGHDLKTPLNAILGFADMMRSGVRGDLEPVHQEYTEIIHDSGQDLLLLVDDILDLAKADAQSLRLDREPVDLAASGASVMRQLGAQAARAEVELKLIGDEEAWADADARAVRQIWQNLVSNAIKYSSAGDTVELAVRTRDDDVLLSVEDQGAGMDEADLARIAEPFAQGRNAAGRSGTGLGLAVVKTFADLHGGKVRIDSAPGQGTRVEVTFPPAQPEPMTKFDRAAQ